MMTSEDIKRIMPDDLAMRRIKRAEKACREAQNDEWMEVPEVVEEDHRNLSPEPQNVFQD